MPFLRDRGIRAVLQGHTTLIGEICRDDLSRINAQLIARAAREGDEIAMDIYEKAGF